jgi:ribonuclease BN (tRNA processing enzyme)
MTDGITVRILGDFGPFSRMGKSIGYLLEIGASRYLIDCGAPLFQQIGGHGLKNIDGLIITHSHEDHKRWFTDLALFSRYASNVAYKVLLITSESVHEEVMLSSMPALGKSLSPDSKRIIDVAYGEFVECRTIGPKARYRIMMTDEGMGKTRPVITDGKGHIIGPEKAKIIISRKTGRPRMLFKDPDYEEWVEPESFYPLSSSVFYEEEKNVLGGGDFTIEAIKAPVWHGVSGIGVKVRTEKETLVFSSDTCHDEELWRRLCFEKRTRVLHMPEKDFEASTVIYGDINDYIERCWSEERYREAVNAFDGAVVIHDVYSQNSVVHTGYEKLKNTSLKREMAILTHSPDRMTSEWVLCDTDKTFRIVGKKFYEMVGSDLYLMDADVYHKEGGKYYAGYRNEWGKYTLYEKDGLLRFASYDGGHIGSPLYNVDLYEDISGRYFPKIERQDAFYRQRSDGRVELVEWTQEGSVGKIVENHRKMPGQESNQRMRRDERSAE